MVTQLPDNIIAAQLPNQVIIEMAKRSHRIHHYLFHAVRNNWVFYDEDTKNKLRNMGWEPPRPALKEDPTSPTGWSAILDNYSGEDFLYMHREMIKYVNEILAQVHDPQYPKVNGWEIVPRPGDLEYPVPPAWMDGVRLVKSDEYFETRFIPWEQQYTNPEYLSRVSLGQLGAEIEFSIHNAMHMRWASQPSGTRPGADPTRPDLIDVIWDDPSYNYLGDTYSSHVNPIFWNLHGWIDNRIEDWKYANEITGDIQWTGTWVGHMHGHETSNRMLKELSIPKKEETDNMMGVLKIIEDKNKINGFPIIGPFF